MKAKAKERQLRKPADFVVEKFPQQNTKARDELGKMAYLAERANNCCYGEKQRESGGAVCQISDKPEIDTKREIAKPMYRAYRLQSAFADFCKG